MPVEVTGLNELVRAFARIDKGMSRQFRQELRVGVGGPVAAEMKAMAASRGLRQTGKLINSLRPSVRGSTLFINASATNRGYPYPAGYEFGRGGARAVMEPGVRRRRAGGLEQGKIRSFAWDGQEYL